MKLSQVAILLMALAALITSGCINKDETAVTYVLKLEDMHLDATNISITERNNGTELIIKQLDGQIPLQIDCLCGEIKQIGDNMSELDTFCPVAVSSSSLTSRYQINGEILPLKKIEMKNRIDYVIFHPRNYSMENYGNMRITFPTPDMYGWVRGEIHVKLV